MTDGSNSTASMKPRTSGHRMMQRPMPPTSCRMIEEPNYECEGKKYEVYWVTDPSAVSTAPCRSGEEVISAVATLGGVGTDQFAIGTFLHSKKCLQELLFVARHASVHRIGLSTPMSRESEGSSQHLTSPIMPFIGRYFKICAIVLNAHLSPVVVAAFVFPVPPRPSPIPRIPSSIPPPLPFPDPSTHPSANTSIPAHNPADTPLHHQ